MMGFYAIAGAPVASRGMFEGIYRILPFGGGFAGGDVDVLDDHFPLDWNSYVGRCGAGGAWCGGAAHYPPRFAYPPSGVGSIGGGKATYPVRWDRPYPGMVGGGQAKYPARIGTWTGGAISGRTTSFEGQTDWRYWWGLHIGQTNTGAIAGGIAPYGLVEHHSLTMRRYITAYSFELTGSNTTFKLISD